MIFRLPTTPCFTKKDLVLVFKSSPSALSARIRILLKNKKLLQLKKGLYATSERYFDEPDKTKFTEFIATQIRQPSYLSLTYVLQKHKLLIDPSGDSRRAPLSPVFTCITTKTPRKVRNSLGTFHYSNLKKSLYHGFQEIAYGSHVYHIATKAKALFDFLYLQPKLQYRNQRKLKNNLFVKLHLNLENFSEKDFQEFEDYVWESNCKKMMRVRHGLEEYFAGKKFDAWAKELLKE